MPCGSNMILKADDVTRALKKKGFEQVSGRQKHPRYTFYANGKRSPVTTHVSHNKQELNDFLLAKMAEQTYLSKSEFLEMISCTIGHEDLVKRYADLDLVKE